ncbi:MAG: hypothetical protein FJ276_05190 [Planctomycetes bacterium]|nr:hypothetical protein [Planctomycetota bacterium]
MDPIPVRQRRALQRLALLPCQPNDGLLSRDGCGGGPDLLPFLLDAWRQSPFAAGASASHRRDSRVADDLARHAANAARLTWGTADGSCGRVAAWIGQRLIWWPRGIPIGRRIGVVSSRLGRMLEDRLSCFAALRAVCQAMDPRREILLTAEATATARFLQRCSLLFEIPLLSFRVSRPNQSVRRWFEDCLSAKINLSGATELAWTAFVSPPLDEGSDGPRPVAGGTVGPVAAGGRRTRRDCRRTVEPRNDPAPLRDRLVVAASDRIVACHVRPGGHVEDLIVRRLRDRAGQDAADVVLMVGDGLVSPRLARKMQTHGARLVQFGDPSCPTSNMEMSLVNHQGSPGRIITWADMGPADYLTHCTRRQDGPWPDQSEEDYLDDFLLARPGSDHSPLAALRRIATNQVLRGSASAIRGGTKVVCFTAVGLNEIGSLRTFRPHRGRWDFEPYGISISRNWLQDRGTRPVRYGDATEWDCLPDSERPFFQCRFAGQQATIDWSVEREWRHVGDVDLKPLPSNAALLFVPSASEANALAPHSRWPVLVVEP